MCGIFLDMAPIQHSSSLSPFPENPFSNSAETQKKTGRLLSIESWLFNRDPYVMVYESPYNWVVLIIPYIQQTTCFFLIAHKTKV